MTRSTDHLGCMGAALALLALSAGPLRAQGAAPIPHDPFPNAAVSLALVGPMTGPLSDAGKAMAAGAALAVSQVNGRGGIAGRPIALTVENDEASTLVARRIAETLAAKKTRIVVGHYTSAPTAFGAEVYARENILLVAPTATTPALPAKPGAPFLRLAPPEDAQATFAGEAMARDYPKGEIVILHDATALSRTLARAAASAIGSTREPPVQRELPPLDTPDQARALARAVAAQGPAALYYAAGPGLAAIVLRALRETGSQTPVWATDMLATPEFAAAAGEALDGLRMAAPTPFDRAPANLDIVRRLQGDGVKDIALALANYAAVQVVAEAARRAGAADPSSMAKAMRGASPLQSAIGTISFDERGERVERAFSILRWRRAEDGRFVISP